MTDDLRCGMDHVDVGGTKSEDIVGLPSRMESEGSVKGAYKIFKSAYDAGKYKFVR